MEEQLRAVEIRVIEVGVKPRFEKSPRDSELPPVFPIEPEQE